MEEEYGFFNTEYEEEETYREYQARLRSYGFTPYNCDYVDEFPTW